jgi:hypothetical protein
VLCGYLDADLKGVADDILVEAGPEPFMGPEVREIEARDLRKEARFERTPAPQPAYEPQPYLDFGPDAEYEPEPDYEPAHDYEAELDAEPDTAELEAVTVAPEPVQHELDGVTQSVDFGWDDPEDFSAPV